MLLIVKPFKIDTHSKAHTDTFKTFVAKNAEIVIVIICSTSWVLCDEYKQEKEEHRYT